MGARNGRTPIRAPFPTSRRRASTGCRIVLVGHASLLIQAAGLNILVDPVWSERASPFTFVGPQRVNPPGIAFADLPPIDAVLVTHNHYDHLDRATVGRLWHAHRPRIVAPLGNDAIIRDFDDGIAVETYDWGAVGRAVGTASRCISSRPITGRRAASTTGAWRCGAPMC